MNDREDFIAEKEKEESSSSSDGNKNIHNFLMESRDDMFRTDETYKAPK